MIQIIIILVILLGAGGFGGWTYMEKLRADNQVLQINQEVLKENELKLNDAIAEQQAVIVEKQRQPVVLLSHHLTSIHFLLILLD